MQKTQSRGTCGNPNVGKQRVQASFLSRVRLFPRRDCRGTSAGRGLCRHIDIGDLSVKKFQIAGKRASGPPSRKNGAGKKIFEAWKKNSGAGNFFSGARIFSSRRQDSGAGLPKKQKSPMKRCTKGLFCAKNACFFLCFALQAQKPRHGNLSKSGKKKLVPPPG